MAQSLGSIYIHIIFSTKNRFPFLRDKEVKEKLHAYLSGICKNLKCPSFMIGGTTDHIHILCQLSRNVTISNLVRDLKKGSSIWLKEQGVEYKKFYWQNGYGVFSISPSHVNALKNYILKQEEHHRKETFQDEFRRFLKKYDISFDERYVWD
jgi:putative transposase